LTEIKYLILLIKNKVYYILCSPYCEGSDNYITVSHYVLQDLETPIKFNLLKKIIIIIFCESYSYNIL